MYPQAYKAAFRRLAELKGDPRYVLTDAQHVLEASLGTELFSITRGLLTMGGIVDADAPLDHELIAEAAGARKAAYRELTKDGIPPLPGAIETARHPKRLVSSIPVGGLALVSTSPMYELQPFAETHGLNFDVIISKEDVGDRVKPDPLAYVLAAERLGVSPAEMIVVEDSPSGVRAAHGADCFTIGLGSSQELFEAGANLLVPTQDGLRAALNDLLIPR